MKRSAKLLGIVFVSSLMVTLFAPSAFAFRVEGFDWGENHDMVFGKVGDMGLNVRPESTDQLLVVDAKLLDEDCFIKFFFNDAQKLNKIEVLWETSKIGPVVLEKLIWRYGNPYKYAKFKKHYEWKGAHHNEIITLDFYRDPVILYTHTTVTFDAGKDYQ